MFGYENGCSCALQFKLSGAARGRYGRVQILQSDFWTFIVLLRFSLNVYIDYDAVISVSEKRS